MDIEPNVSNKKYFLLLILLVAGVLRIYHLDFQSIWIDEVNSMVQARPDLSFTETYKGLSMDLQPPLYFYLLKLFFTLFGYTTFVLRLFSALMGIAGVWAIYRLGREIHNHQTGIYAALLLSVNYFHLYYSQEARPYSFLFLFTVLSFEQLIRLIKSPSVLRACVYGLLSCLMLYGHAFGMILLFAQYLILLICIISADKTERWTIFRLSALAAAIAGLFYIPALKLFITAADVKSFWIPMPGADVFAQILSDFFGRSETVLTLVYLLLVFYFYSVFNSRSENSFLKGLRANNAGTVLAVLSLWLLCGLMIPLIRSYLKVPMIVSRYMIGVLPVIMLMMAIGISEIGQKITRFLIVTVFVLFSLTHIFVVKNFYNTISKSQLREITEYIKKNNNGKEAVVTDLWWHYAHFLDKNIWQIPQLSPAEYVTGLMAHPEKTSNPFWYSSAHHFTFDKLPEAQRKFLEENFEVDQKLELQEAWAMHFVPRSGSEPVFVNLSDFSPLNAGSGDHIFLYNDTLTNSAPFHLLPGRYRLVIDGRSEPAEALNNINAHVSLLLNGKRIGGLFLREGEFPSPQQIKVSITDSTELRLGIAFDNDRTYDKKDRNALIYSVRFEKESKQVGESGK